MLAGCLSDRVAKLVPKTVTLNDLLLVFLKIDQKRLLEESWVFVPDPNIAFHRISEQESFDPSMTPNGSIVCCEIMSSEERPIGRHSDAELVQEVLNGLDAMGYDGFDVLDQRVIRLPRSYPVFRPGFQVALKEILSELDALRNFRTVGRQGAFNYIGTLDAMDIGYGTSTWLSAPESVSWVEERERTSHFPVLD
jgi:protoporphyrinogen oxidase